METITRNITDLADDERTVLERFVGKRLAENQRIVVQVLDDTDVKSLQTSPRSIADYAILADLDAASMELFDEAIQRSPSRDQPML
jgi:hypothetical protein